MTGSNERSMVRARALSLSVRGLRFQMDPKGDSTMFKKLGDHDGPEGPDDRCRAAQSAPSADRPASPPPAAMDRPDAARSGRAVWFRAVRQLAKARSIPGVGSRAPTCSVPTTRDRRRQRHPVRQGRQDRRVHRAWAASLGMGAKDIALAPAFVYDRRRRPSKNEATSWRSGHE